MKSSDEQTQSIEFLNRATAVLIALEDDIARLQQQHAERLQALHEQIKHAPDAAVVEAVGGKGVTLLDDLARAEGEMQALAQLIRTSVVELRWRWAEWLGRRN